MTIFVSNAAAQAAANAIADLIDAGTTNANGKAFIYDGSIPADADTALSGNTQLAEVDLQNPAFNSAADASPGATFTLQGVPLSDNSIDATGTATFFRLVDRDETAVIQGSAGTSGTDMILDTDSFVSGATFSITALTATSPES